MPGAIPTTLTFGASAIANSLVASFNAAFESVYERKSGFGFSSFWSSKLITTPRASCFRCSCSERASKMGAAVFVRIARIRWSALNRVTLSYSNSEALLTTQLTGRELVGAFRKQAQHAGLDRQIAIDRYRAPAERFNLRHGVHRVVARSRIVDRDVPSIARKRERNLAPDAACATSDERGPIR